MKNLIIILVFLNLIWVSQAQTIFKDISEGLEAQEIGTLKEYQPSYFSGHTELQEGQKIIIFTGWVKMRVVGGIFWVWAQDEEFVADVNGNIIRRWDCGNIVVEVYDPSSIIVVPEFPPEISEQKSLAFKPEEEKNINININVSNPAPPVLPPTPNVEESGFPWDTALITLLTLGALYLGYDLVKTHLENDRRESKSSNISGGGVLPPNKAIYIGGSWAIQ